MGVGRYPGLLGILSAANVVYAATPGTFEIVGNSGASAQQMFLTTERTVQIVDKTERNANDSFAIGGHPAWSSQYDLLTNEATPQDIITNSFCAGGNVLGNGTWVNVGGNGPVGTSGLDSASGQGPYQDTAGGRTVRTLTPCDPNSLTYCDADWVEWTGMPTSRWYPTLETLADGVIMVIGGELRGGYVDNFSENQNVPNYEFIPNKGAPVPMQFLTDTMPLSLFPLTWLLPSGLLLMQAANAAQLWDVTNLQATALPDIPGGQRVYPASAGSTALPMTPANGYNLTAIFCGGLNQNFLVDYNPGINNVSDFTAIQSCQTITPDVSHTWQATDDLIQGTVMLSLINLPDGRLFGLNGVGKGTAGYGWQQFGPGLNANGQGYGRVPRLMPAGYYNHSAPLGARWSQTGVQASTIPRMYHSSATLLPDGAILVAGSNPSADFVGVTSSGVHVNSSDPYPTEYRVEKFFPDYYNKARPMPSGLPASISYGGDHFDLTLPKSNITSRADLDSIKVVLIRTGFSTHAINFGQRHVELPVSYSWELDGSATLHVGQLPPNPNILAPGPCLIFVMLNGAPSYGKFVMVGNGKLGEQPTAAATDLPANAVPLLDAQASSSASAGSASSAAGAAASSAAASHQQSVHLGAVVGGIAAGVVALIALVALIFCCRRRQKKTAQMAQRRSYRPARMPTSEMAYPVLPYIGSGTRSGASSTQDLLAKAPDSTRSRQSSAFTLPYTPGLKQSSRDDLLKSPFFGQP